MLRECDRKYKTQSGIIMIIPIINTMQKGVQSDMFYHGSTVWFYVVIMYATHVKRGKSNFGYCSILIKFEGLIME